MAIPQTVVNKVQQIVRDDINALHVFRELGKRERRVKKIDVYRLKLNLVRGGIHLGELQMHQIFERLERAGAGQFKVRKYPDHSVFLINYTLDEFVRAVMAGIGGSPTPPEKTPYKSNASVIRVFCPLRGESIGLALPKDFNTADAQQLGAFLMSVARQNERGEF